MSKTVAISTTSPTGAPARRVIAATSATVPLGDRLEGGAATPVYVVSQAQVDAGWRVQGNVPELVVVANDGRAVAGRRPVPVYVVSGSFT